jgi:hypothetical protein
MAVYLTDPAIDRRGRVRRNMNYRLDAFCEQTRLVGGFPDNDAAWMADRHRQRRGDFERAARRHGYTVGALRSEATASCWDVGTHKAGISPVAMGRDGSVIHSLHEPG